MDSGDGVGDDLVRGVGIPGGGFSGAVGRVGVLSLRSCVERVS